MIRLAIPFLDDRTPDWQEIERIEADYENVDVPCLILWGQRDETFPVSMGYKLKDQLPDARLRIFPQTKHSILSERPLLCAESIRNFVRLPRGGPGWPAIDRINTSVVEASTNFKKGQITEAVFRRTVEAEIRAVEAVFRASQRVP